MSNRVILSAWWMLWTAACAFGQAPPADSDILTVQERLLSGDEFKLVLEPEEAELVEKLVTQLSGPDFSVREKAAADLVEIGAGAFSRLREIYDHAEDLESRLRIEEIVRTAYLNHHALNRHGFLGISMRAFDPKLKEQNRAQGLQLPPVELPPDRVGVWVQNVIPNTGASRAGLLVNDVLIGINGSEVTGSGHDIQESFSAIIRQHPPGSVVKIELVRGKEVLTVEALLGRPPEKVARDSRIIKITELYNAAAARFPEWWDRYFAGERGAKQAIAAEKP